MSKDDLIAKFRDCAVYSAKPMSKDDVGRVIQQFEFLEDVEDIGKLIDLL